MPRSLTRTRTAGSVGKYVSDENDSESTEEAPRSETPRRSTPRADRVRSSRAEGGDESPRSRRGEVKAGPHASGWAGHDRLKQSVSDFPLEYKIDDEAKFIKFLDGEPFLTYLQHWLDEVGPGQRKSYNCLGDECPLCQWGAQRSQRTCFNIVDLADPDNPEVKVLVVGPALASQIRNFAEDPNPKSACTPINRDDCYWRISKSGGGKRGKVQYTLVPVKERDLESDYDIPPLTEQELDELDTKRYSGEDFLRYDSVKFLEDLLASLE